MKTFLVPEIKRRVSEETGYDIEISEQYGGAVAKLGECPEAVETGLLDIAMINSCSFERSKLPVHCFAWWLPFGPVDTMQGLEAARLTLKWVPELDENFQKYNQTNIAQSMVASYHLVTNFPITTMEDLKGKRIAHGGAMLPWMEALGAVGVQSMLNEAYTCLDTGVYDGWAMEPNATKGFKMIDPAPYYTLVDFGCASACTITMNNDTLASLPAEVRNIILEVGREYEEVNAQTAKERCDGIIQSWRDDPKYTVSQISDEEKTRWAKAMHAANVALDVIEEAEATGMPATEIAWNYVNACKQVGYTYPYLPDFLK